MKAPESDERSMQSNQTVIPAVYNPEGTPRNPRQIDVHTAEESFKTEETTASLGTKNKTDDMMRVTKDSQKMIRQKTDGQPGRRTRDMYGSGDD